MFVLFQYRLSDVRFFWRLDRNRIHHDVGCHIFGSLLRHCTSPERGRQNYQTEGQDLDRSDLDVRIHVLHNTGIGFGVQSVRARRVSDQLQFRLLDGRKKRKRVHPSVLYSGLVHTLHHDIVLLREDLDGSLGDQRDGSQQVWPGRRKEEDGNTAGLRGDRCYRALVLIVDAVRNGCVAGRVRPKRIRHAADHNDSSAILQIGQLHGPVDLRYHASEVQERTDETTVAEEDQKIGAG